MKKKIICCISVFLLLIFSSVSAAASDNGTRVIDNAGLMSSEEEQELESSISEIQKEYNFDVVILTTDSTDGKSVTAYADDYYDYGDYGLDSEKSGLLFLISMEDRDWYISTTGYGITAFTDYGIQEIGDDITGNLSDGDYAGAMKIFLKDVNTYLQEAKNGTPVDTNNRPVTQSQKTLYIVIVLVIALAIGLTVVLVMRHSMNTARQKSGAEDYVRGGSFNVDAGNDLFLYSTVSKTPRPQATGGGGSSTHIGSSGVSHGGGGGHF
jgi:uncharacterized protein